MESFQNYESLNLPMTDYVVETEIRGHIKDFNKTMEKDHEVVDEGGTKGMQSRMVEAMMKGDQSEGEGLESD